MNKKENSISIIIPTYNGERVLKRAIDSIRKQTYKGDIEILVCDDYSTDHTVDIAKERGCIVYTNDQHTSGPNAGRNLGIKHASGDIIAFMDQDDEWLEDKLLTQLKELNNGANFVYSSCIKKQG